VAVAGHSISVVGPDLDLDILVAEHGRDFVDVPMGFWEARSMVDSVRAVRVVIALAAPGDCSIRSMPSRAVVGFFVYRELRSVVAAIKAERF
jgi:hypothetical protein